MEPICVQQRVGERRGIADQRAAGETGTDLGQTGRDERQIDDDQGVIRIIQ